MFKDQGKLTELIYKEIHVYAETKSIIESSFTLLILKKGHSNRSIAVLQLQYMLHHYWLEARCACIS